MKIKITFRSNSGVEFREKCPVNIFIFFTCLNCSSKLQAEDGSPPLVELCGVGGWLGLLVVRDRPRGLPRKGFCWPACRRKASRAGRPDMSIRSRGLSGNRSDRIPMLGFMSSLRSLSSSRARLSSVLSWWGLSGPDTPLPGL